MKNSTESSNLSPSSATEEELIFNPYNHNNVQITEHDIVTILKRYGLPPALLILNFGAALLFTDRIPSDQKLKMKQMKLLLHQNHQVVYRFLQSQMSVLNFLAMVF